MKARQLYAQCLKARIVSWLNTGKVACIVPGLDGTPVMLAAYDNGRYIEPEIVHIPNDARNIWGPDGPVNMEQETPEEGEEEDEDGTE